jgi:hypothetical protein
MIHLYINSTMHHIPMKPHRSIFIYASCINDNSLIHLHLGQYILHLTSIINQSILCDAGASLHLSNAPTFQHISAHFREGEALTLPFLNLKYNPIRIHVVSLSENQAISLNRQKIRSPLMADRLMALGSIQTRWPFMKLQCNR